jgi:hypothetical protein
MGKKIRLEAGFFGEGGESVSDTVFDRPVMMVYVGSFDSMDGPVTISEETIDLLARNHNSLLEKVKRLMNGAVPMKDCPPLQLDHSAAATHTIGRLVGPLTKGLANIDGAEVPALFGTARFLGRENVEKAQDGRYTHVSIGADLEEGIINELSVTPFPAAPKAALLSKKRLAAFDGVEYEVVEVSPGEYDIYVGGEIVTHHAGSASEVDAEAKRYIQEKKGDASMHEKLKKHLMDKKKMSAEDAEKLSKECLAHHMKHMGMDEEKMGKHMADAKDEEMSRMSDEYDTAMKHLKETDGGTGGESDDKRMARKAEFTKLALGVRAGNSELRTDLRKATIAARLSRLRSEGKITPAEMKKLDVVKMSLLTDGEMNAALSSFDSREPFPLGVAHGTTKAEAIDKITKKYRMAKLELETRMNMPSKRAEAAAKLARLGEEEKKELAEVGNPNENDAPSKGMLTKLTYDEMCKMLEDKDKHEELKKHLKHMMDHHGIEIPEQSDAHMSALAKKQSELQTNLEQLIALASPVLGIQPNELK